jgi:hypothetical protein
MILIKFVVLCFIVFLCASPSCELVVFDPSKWLYRTRSEGLTGYSCLSVLLPLRVRLGHLRWNNSGGSTTNTAIRAPRQSPLREALSGLCHGVACVRHQWAVQCPPLPRIVKMAPRQEGSGFSDLRPVEKTHT